MRYTEEQLNSWTRPASKTEESKMQNAEHMVREAIRSDEKLEGKSIDIFGQGSYANNTNVRQNSDIDINVCLKDVFYFELPQGLSEEDAGINHLSKSIYSYPDFKNDVEVALVNKFGRNDIIRKNKCMELQTNLRQKVKLHY